MQTPPKASQADHFRPRVVRVAARMFKQRGFGRTSFNAISQATGIAKHLLAIVWPSKEKLWDECCEKTSLGDGAPDPDVVGRIVLSRAYSVARNLRFPVQNRDTDDLASEIIVRVWPAAMRWRPGPKTLEAFIGGLCYMRLRDLLREVRSTRQVAEGGKAIQGARRVELNPLDALGNHQLNAPGRSTGNSTAGALELEEVGRVNGARVYRIGKVSEVNDAAA